MRNIRKYNNNIILADDNGQEVVVLGKGIGFQVPQGAEVDVSLVEKVFVPQETAHINRFAAILSDLPYEYLLLASKIVDFGKAALQVHLNPSIVVALADHLFVSLEQMTNNDAAQPSLESPLQLDVRHIYPSEFKTGIEALEIIRRERNIQLPESEAVSIALHFINAELESPEMPTTFKMVTITGDVMRIIEQYYDVALDKKSLEFMRFSNHVRNLVMEYLTPPPPPQVSAGHRRRHRAVRTLDDAQQGCRRVLRTHLFLAARQTRSLSPQKRHLVFGDAYNKNTTRNGKEMTSRKLIFLDIDGTLTSVFNHVPASALDACRAARKNGHLLYIATGRSRAQISDSILEVGFDGIVCSGGAYIEIDGQAVFSAFLPRITLERLIAYFSGRNARYSMDLPEKIIASPEFYSFAPRPLLRFLHNSYAPLGEDFDRERVCKLVFMESERVSFEDAQSEFGADCEIFRNSIPIPGLSGGEISAKGVHKGSAAAWVARHYGVDRKDVIAFGDSDNDRAMLEYAGVGVAMGNGDEALKRIADDVAGHVRRGGLAKAFKKYGLV